MTGWIRAIRKGWVVDRDLPGPDVDEFADPHQVQQALAADAAAARTLLAVQHPHRTPLATAENLALTDALSYAKKTLRHLRRTYYRKHRDFIALYRVRGHDGVASGLLCIVDPAAFGTDGNTYVRHTEEVYQDVVAERAEMLTRLRCATSAAMLVPATGGEYLTEVVERAMAMLGDPAVATKDPAERLHEIWLVPSGPLQDELLAVAAANPLLVADGNHRVAAARCSGLGAMLALVTGGPDLTIGPIHRQIHGQRDYAEAWRNLGLTVEPADPEEEPQPGIVIAHTHDGVFRVHLPEVAPGEPQPRVDHADVEGLLIGRALGLDPAGSHVRPLPGPLFNGTLPPEAGAVLLIAPVPLADMLAVHNQGRQMTRKATYFTPKPRSGLLLAKL
ncbi:DUF1015 family protein [Pseudonocardiaceae bacterium YIM PH 21723]|nr:DUF1015 family protein [Pseudonocardiaceae bacterium YIM PH 21723]